MTKEEYLKLAEEKWPEVEKLEKESPDLYSFEQGLERIMIELTQSALSKSLNTNSKDHRFKKKS